MFEAFAIIVVAMTFAAAIAYAINKNAKGGSAKKPAPVAPVAPESAAVPQTVTLPGGGTVDIPNIPNSTPAPAPAAKPKPKKKKAKAPAATYPNPVQNMAPDGTKEPPPVNTWKM